MRPHREALLMAAGPWMGRTVEAPETEALIAQYQDYWQWSVQSRSGYTNWCLLWAMRLILDTRPELQWPPERVRWHGSVGTLAGHLRESRPAELVPVREARACDLVLHTQEQGHAGIVMFDGARLGTVEANVSRRVDVRTREYEYWALAWRWWEE